MRISLQQRRQYLFSGCKQHKLDFDSYNENNKFGAALPPVSYNFDADLEDLQYPTEYPAERPEDEEDE